MGGVTPVPAFPKSGQGSGLEIALILPHYRLRPCRDADIPFLRRLYRHTRAEELERTGWAEEMKKLFCEQQFNAQHVDYLLRFPLAEYLLVLNGRDPIGRVYVDRSGPDIHLVEISLLPNHRGAGIGSSVLRALQHSATQRNCAVLLSVALDNLRAAALYRRMGFKAEEMGATHRKMRWTPDADSDQS